MIGGTRTDWPTAATPWLAFDRNCNGSIDSGAELFGSATRIHGVPAENGFEALAALDADFSGAIGIEDPDFAKLVLWADANGDRVSQPDELQPLAAAGVTSLELSFQIDPRCDSRGNCEKERAQFYFRTEDGQVRTGALIDVHLRVQAR